MWDTNTFLGAFTPKFYVALTGTSSLISGLILIFEWWYFRKYGTSFIEQVSVTHLGPWLGGVPAELEAGGATAGAGATGSTATLECKVLRNPMALLRGAEYGRLWSAARRAPLTYFDMNLSAQDHQAWFGCSAEEAYLISKNKSYTEQLQLLTKRVLSKLTQPFRRFAITDRQTNIVLLTPAEECMSRAWREREPGARVAAARAALAREPDCAPALLLLAEEEAPTVLEAERVLKRAWRAAEAAWRSHGTGTGTGARAQIARRDANVLAHVKRRVAMCARRLGRLRDAARLFRELTRDAPPALHALAPHENLLEVLLEQRLYADAAAVLARHEDAGSPPSAATLYTAALLLARSPQEPAALEALRRAIEFNPHVPEYLLELRALTLPPEHVLRRGDSEAVAYAFWHLRHWRAAEGALRLLGVAWRAAERAGALCAGGGGPGGVGGCAQCADRELLAPHHAGSGAGAGWGAGLGRMPRRVALLPVAAAVCALAALVALAAHRWPAQAQALLDPRRLHSLLGAV